MNHIHMDRVLKLILFLTIGLFPLIIKRERRFELKSQADALPMKKVNDTLYDQDVADFIKWEKKIGIYRVKTAIKTISRGFRGIFATEDIEPNEVISDIPLYAMVSTESPSDDPIIERAKRLLNMNNLLTVMIYREVNSSNSLYGSYYRFFPCTLDNFPLFYKEEQRSMLKGTSILEAIDEHIKIMNDRYVMVKKALPELENLTLPIFYKYYTYASSRSLLLTVNRVRQAVLVPTFDMINAAPYKRDPLHNVIVRYMDQHAGVPFLRMTANKRIKAGKQLYEFYRTDYTNSEYLLNYGFTFPYISDASLRFRFEINKTDPDYELKKQVLKGMANVGVVNDTITIYLRNTNTEKYYRILYSAVRVLELNDTQKLNSSIETIATYKDHVDLHFSNENEKSAMTRLMNMAYKKLNNYTTNIEEDEKLISNYPLYSTPRSIIQVRSEEKRGILKIIEFARDSLFRISDN